MTTEEFHKALFEFIQNTIEEYQEDNLNWYLAPPIQANYPWYYIDFEISEKIYYQALQALDGTVRGFCGKTGAALESISIRPSTKMSVVLRIVLLWNERPPKPPVDPNAPHVHEYTRDVDDHDAWSCTCGSTATK